MNSIEKVVQILLANNRESTCSKCNLLVVTKPHGTTFTCLEHYFVYTTTTYSPIYLPKQKANFN